MSLWTEERICLRDKIYYDWQVASGNHTLVIPVDAEISDELLPRKRQEHVAAPPPENLLDILPVLVSNLFSDDSELQIEGTIRFYGFLPFECPPVHERIKEAQDVIKEAGVVIRLVAFLHKEDLPQLQLEAARVLTKIAAGTTEDTKEVIHAGAVKSFVSLLDSHCDDLRQQAICALGCIAGDSPECRDFVLDFGAMSPLVSRLHAETKISLLRKAGWTLANLCRGGPFFPQVMPALSTLFGLIDLTDEEVLTGVSWALCGISACRKGDTFSGIEFKVAFKDKIYRRLLELLAHPSPSVVLPIVMTFGHLGSSTDIVKADFLPGLLSLLTHPECIVKEKACWTILKLANSFYFDLQAIYRADFCEALINLFQTQHFHLKIEVARCIRKLISRSSFDQTKLLITLECLKGICDGLTCTETSMVDACYTIIHELLFYGPWDDEQDYFAKLVEESEFLQHMEDLRGRLDKYLNDMAEYFFEMWDGAPREVFDFDAYNLLVAQAEANQNNPQPHI